MTTISYSAQVGTTNDGFITAFFTLTSKAKIWLQENNTDIEVDKELEEMGISKQEIVVGFHHPSMREYSDFAIA
jgi:XisI protein